MKNLQTLIASAALVSALLFSKSSEGQINNPLETDPAVWNSREIMMIWGLQNNDSQIELNQGIFGVNYIEYLQSGSAPFETRVAPTVVSPGVANPGLRHMAVQAADCDGDGKDELLYAIGENNKIKLTMPSIDAITNADESISINFSSPASSLEVATGVSGSSSNTGMPLLIRGDFDGDGSEEFALGARNSGGGTIIQIIDTDGGMIPNLRANNHNETSVLSEWGAEVFDICAGDFNGDGTDEIALVVLKNPSATGDYDVFLRIFDITGAGSTTLVEKAGTVIDNQSITPMETSDNDLATVKVSVQALKMPGSDIEKIVVGYSFDPHESDINNLFVDLIDVSEDLQTASVISGYSQMTTMLHQQMLDIKCGDVNGDSKQDVVIMSGGEFLVFDVNDATLELMNSASEANYQSENEEYQNNNFELSDIDKNGRENVLYAFTQYNTPSAGDRRLSVKSVEFNPDFSTGTIIEKEIVAAEDYSLSQMFFGLTAGNFDGDDLTLGQPVEYECMYRRPLFILAPPPIHFDHINGVNYDESGCFTGSDCLFYASNTESEISTSTLSVEEKNDWSVSGSVTAGYQGLAVSVQASMSAKYGEQFSNQSSNGEEHSVVMHNTVTIDDFIKGVKYKVKVFEYPVYNANGDLINFVSAAFPKYDELSDYQEQGKVDPNYIPYYEPGNLLSYPPISTVEAFEAFEPGALIFAGPEYTMTNNPGQSSFADISVSNIYSETGSRSWEAGVASSLSAEGFGLGFELNGEYNTGGMKINSSTISGTEGFRIRYDNIGGPSGFNAYRVKPYIFWTRDGAGMLAYQVDVASSESSPTWWDINYGQKPDPALMMPQRNEVYWTSGADADNPIFTRSKSMRFNRLYPNIGDEVTVECTVYNYSLKSTTEAVTVSFYNGNPNDGGELVADINGETVFTTAGAIPARGRSTVSMTFNMPFPVIPGEEFVRFYAVIDPQNTIDEVHEENNMGWQTLGYDCTGQSGTTSIYEYYQKENFTEMWVWPNPATDRINLAFNMATSGEGVVELYDMQGRLVLSTATGMFDAGPGELAIDLPDLAPGLYFVQLNTAQFRKTHKIMLR